MEVYFVPHVDCHGRWIERDGPTPRSLDFYVRCHPKPFVYKNDFSYVETLQQRVLDACEPFFTKWEKF